MDMKKGLNLALMTSLLVLLACQKSSQSHTFPAPPTEPTITVQNVREVKVRDLALRFPTRGQAISEAAPGTYLLSQVNVYTQDPSMNSIGACELTLEFPGVFGPGAQARHASQWGLRQRDFIA